MNCWALLATIAAISSGPKSQWATLRAPRSRGVDNTPHEGGLRRRPGTASPENHKSSGWLDGCKECRQ